MTAHTLLYLMDLLGTFFFALSGGFRAVKYEMDILGVVVLSIAVGVGGGMIRDTILGLTPPAALQNNVYFLVCAAAGIAVFLFAPKIARRWDAVVLADAVGLGVFAAIGASKAAAVGLGATGVILCGTISAVGGGVVRDVLVGEIPAIFTTGFYASTAIIGSTAFWALERLGVHAGASFSVAAVLTTALRFLAIRYDFGLPRVRRLPASPSEMAQQHRHLRHQRRAKQSKKSGTG